MHTHSKEKKELTQKELKHLLKYDPLTGVFTRATTWYGIKKGTVVGSINSLGYLRVDLYGRNYFCHRLAFLYMVGYLPENGVDHRDRDRVNNKWSNLREASKSCNARNAKVNSRNTSGVVGVSFDGRRMMWEAYITILGRRKALGYHDYLCDAATARWKAEVKYGFHDCNPTSSALEYINLHGKTF